MRSFLVKRSIEILILALVFIGGLGIYSIHHVYSIEARFPPLGQFIEVESKRLHYIKKEGPAGARTVVLLHGNPDSLYNFKLSVFDRLAASYKVLAIDRPGHGYSERGINEFLSMEDHSRILNKALEKLQVSNPIIVGHSWGGLFALAYARFYPKSVSGIVHFSGIIKGPLDYEMLYLWTLRMPILGHLFSLFYWIPFNEGFLEYLNEGAFMPDPINPEFRDVFVGMTRRPNTLHAFAMDQHAVRQLSIDERLSFYRVKTPMVIVIGDRDEFIPLKHAQYLSRMGQDRSLLTAYYHGHELQFAVPSLLPRALNLLQRKLSSHHHVSGQAGVVDAASGVR